jgi:hypothetical protein
MMTSCGEIKRVIRYASYDKETLGKSESLFLFILETVGRRGFCVVGMVTG